jgi:hypothetical protein
MPFEKCSDYAVIGRFPFVERVSIVLWYKTNVTFAKQDRVLSQVKGYRGNYQAVSDKQSCSQFCTSCVRSSNSVKTLDRRHMYNDS